MGVKRYLMPRPRKYDYKKDYPVKLFIKCPISLINDLENLGVTQSEIQLLLEKEKIVENYLLGIVENNRKKD